MALWLPALSWKLFMVEKRLKLSTPASSRAAKARKHTRLRVVRSAPSR